MIIERRTEWLWFAPEDIVDAYCEVMLLRYEAIIWRIENYNRGKLIGGEERED